MWKIIKAELTYTHSLMFAIYGLFMFIIIFNTLTFPNESGSHPGLIPGIALQVLLMFFVIKYLETWNYEIRETRILRHAILPVPIQQVGLARIYKYAVMIAILIVVGTLLLLLKARAAGMELDIESDYSFLYGWIPIAFGLRLLTEKYGLILFWAILVFIFVCNLTFGTMDHPPLCCEKLTEFTFSSVGAIVTAIIFCAVIQVSFMNRKSYLR